MSARDRILDATAAVLQGDGLMHLTLETVAVRAGVSKGGLLYHFHTKQDLLRGLVDREFDRFEADIEARGEPFARSYVRASEAEPHSGLWLVLLAAAALAPELLDLVRERFRRWQERCEGAGPTVARLAADGLWLADIYGLAPPRGEDRDAVVARMVSLADEGA